MSDVSQVDNRPGNSERQCHRDGEKYLLVMFENGMVLTPNISFILFSEIMSQVDIPLSNISDLEYLGNFPSPP